MEKVDESSESSKVLRIKSSTVPNDRPDFYNWCRQFRVSMLHNRSDHWLDFDLDRDALKIHKKHRECK